MISARDLKDLFSENTPERIILKAQRLAAKGRTDQGIAVMKEAIGRLGELPDLRLEMSTLCLSAGRPREAAESLRALLKADPGQVQRVEEHVGWARTQYPDVEPLYEPLAEGHIARRNHNSAVECLERIDRRKLEAGLEVRLSNLNRFLEKGALVPKSALPTLYFAGLAYEALGDWQKSLDGYRKILTASAGEFSLVDERLKGLVARHYKLCALRLAYAEMLESAGHRDRALSEHLTALEIDPRTAPQVGRFVTSLLAETPGEPALMWASLRVALAQGSIPAALDIGRQLADLGSHLPEVEKMIEDLAGSGKESVETLLLMAHVAGAQGKVQRALAAISTALGNDGGEPAVAALERIVAAFPGEARGYQILADYRLKEGRIDRALEAYRAWRRVDTGSASVITTRLRAVVAADPGNVPARSMLEEIAIETGDPEEAVPFLRQRLRLGDEKAREALSRLRQMMLVSPNHSGLRFAAVEACLALGEPTEAWSHLKELIRSDKPIEPELLHLIVLCGGSSPELSREVSSHVLSLPGASAGLPEVLFALGESAGRAGLFGEAIARYRAAEKAAPDTSEICSAAIRGLAELPGALGEPEDRAALAEALLTVGALGAAIETLRNMGALPPAIASRLVESFTASLRADPSNMALSAGLAEVCLASGQVARALTIARAAIQGREDPASAPMTMIYGDALAKSGRQLEATKAYAAAVRRDPSLAGKIIERLQQVIQVDAGIESAHIALGRLVINEGRIAQGVAALVTAWSIKSDLLPLVMKDLEHTGKRHPAEPSVDMARAQLLTAAGDPVGASAALGSRIEGHPELLDEIIKRLETLVAGSPGCARAHFELGRACHARRWVARACACLMRAYGLDPSLAESIAEPLTRLQRDFPDEPDPHIARGTLYEGESRLVPAAEAFARAVALKGAGAVSGLAGLRRLCSASERVPPEVRLMLLRACRTCDLPNESVAAALDALAQGGDVAAEVRAEMDHLIAASPASAAPRLARALASIRMLDMESAAADLKEALRFDQGCADRVKTLAMEIVASRPGCAAAVLTLAHALELSGDDAGACRALEAAMESAEAQGNVDIILARRTLALRAGDSGQARTLLARAEEACEGKDEFLGRLHREALDAAERKSITGPPSDLEGALDQGDYFRAAAMVASEPASRRKAWIMERCGRFAEAAACLEEMLQTGGAAERYAALHDLLVAREIGGRANALMAQTSVQFEMVESFMKTGARHERAGGSTQGGGR